MSSSGAVPPTLLASTLRACEALAGVTVPEPMGMASGDVIVVCDSFIRLVGEAYHAKPITCYNNSITPCNIYLSYQMSQLQP